MTDLFIIKWSLFGIKCCFSLDKNMNWGDYKMVIDIVKSIYIYPRSININEDISDYLLNEYFISFLLIFSVISSFFELL